MYSNDVRPNQVKVQHRTELAQQIFKETTLECCIEAVVETKVLGLSEATTQEAANGKIPLPIRP